MGIGGYDFGGGVGSSYFLHPIGGASFLFFIPWGVYPGGFIFFFKFQTITTINEMAFSDEAKF